MVPIKLFNNYRQTQGLFQSRELYHVLTRRWLTQITVRGMKNEKNNQKLCL
jgi:hypothetical protein